MSEDLVPLGVVANVPGALGLAARGGDVYAADNDDGTILRIIDGGEVLATPEVFASGLAGPEGIDIKGKTMYVVEGAGETLTAINMKTGARTTIATDLGLQGPSPLSPSGWFNNVTAVGHDVYVNADRANLIYEFSAIR